MNFITKLISPPKKIFVIFLISVYIAMVTYTFPYGLIPSLVISVVTPLSIFLIAYPTYYILLPPVIDEFIDSGKKKKMSKRHYFLLSLLLIAVVMSIIWVYLSITYKIFDLPHDGSQIRIFNPSLFILTYIFSNIFFVHNRHHDYMDKVTNEKKELEMKVLKSQINSHFLFNALNNIYSMTYFDNKEASQYVAKLSQMLRYVLEDCEADHVPISGEIKYIENYMDFQKARYETAKDVTFNYVQNFNGEIQVPPMIFQPLIENCFKYCPLQDNNSYIHIEIVVDQNQVKFIAENTRPLMKQPSERKSGIGTENLRNRLSLSFNEDYSMNVLEKDNLYRTELIINHAKKYECINR